MKTAREVAAHVLVRVDRDSAFAAAALHAELSRAVQLDARDRALATELVYGTLRVRPFLEREIARFTHRGTDKLGDQVRAHLLLCAYQLVFMRVPAFAAVNEAVASVRAARGERLAAFANAVLRKVAVRASEMGQADREEALASSTPPWLARALAAALGQADARAFVASGASSPPLVLRAAEASRRAEWITRLRAAMQGAQFDPGLLSPLAILARGAGAPELLPGYAEGEITAQEEGSQLAALAVAVRRGEAVLDACAGRGQKTAILVRSAGSEGAVDACDALPSKLERLRIELGRVRLAARATHAVDWTAGSGDVSGLYDRALVDAPCSGIGTLRRRPEIAQRRSPTDLVELARIQVAITSRVAGRLRPGGVLLYVVCSVLREEAEDVVQQVLDARPDLALAPFCDGEPVGAPAFAALAAGRCTLRLLPHVHGTDGYFLARFQKADSSAIG